MKRDGLYLLEIQGDRYKAECTDVLKSTYLVDVYGLDAPRQIILKKADEGKTFKIIEKLN